LSRLAPLTAGSLSLRLRLDPETPVSWVLAFAPVQAPLLGDSALLGILPLPPQDGIIAPLSPAVKDKALDFSQKTFKNL